MTQAVRVMSKARKHYPATPTEYLVEIVPGKSIKVSRERNGVLVEGQSFEIGDMAEFDSYNLSYYGKILSITNNTVTVSDNKDGTGRKHRMDLYKFSFRNFDFVLAKKQAENIETSYYI